MSDHRCDHTGPVALTWGGVRFTTVLLPTA